MFIEKSGLTQTALAGKTVILTGAGGGIGYETARALVWLGANVIIAEINADKGKAAEERINGEMNCGRAQFYHIDITDEAQIQALVRHAKQKYGFLDAVFNNATITPLGAVEDVPAAEWDKSCAVNLRAPLLLTQMALPDMKDRNSGALIFVSSSGAAPYMGAYEVFKTAQVELCNTLAAELEDTNINALTIGPGLVKTDTAINGIKKVAAMMGMSTEEFYKMNEAHTITPEEAGVGFALAVVYADKYRGQEVSSIQVLLESGMMDESPFEKAFGTQVNVAELIALISQAVKTFSGQYDDWTRRNVFERQWVLRDFKKRVGDSAEQFRAKMQNIQSIASSGRAGELLSYKRDFERLKEYYEHQYKLLQGYEKDPKKREEYSKVVKGWIENIGSITALL